MPTTQKTNPPSRLCKIKAVNPAFRSVSTPRCPNELGETDRVNPEQVEVIA
jgi:hypothetical protein